MQNSNNLYLWKIMSFKCCPFSASHICALSKTLFMTDCRISGLRFNSLISFLMFDIGDIIILFVFKLYISYIYINCVWHWMTHRGWYAIKTKTPPPPPPNNIKALCKKIASMALWTGSCAKAGVGNLLEKEDQTAMQCLRGEPWY